MKKKQIVIDENAWRLLKAAKKELMDKGVSAPSFSDTIRWLYNRGVAK